MVGVTVHDKTKSQSQPLQGATPGSCILNLLFAVCSVKGVDALEIVKPDGVFSQDLGLVGLRQGAKCLLNCVDGVRVAF